VVEDAEQEGDVAAERVRTYRSAFAAVRVKRRLDAITTSVAPASRCLCESLPGWSTSNS